jgi:hypothetical protein
VRSESADWARAESDELYPSQCRRYSVLRGSFRIGTAGSDPDFGSYVVLATDKTTLNFGIELCVFVAYGVERRVGCVLAGREVAPGGTMRRGLRLSPI